MLTFVLKRTGDVNVFLYQFTPMLRRQCGYEQRSSKVAYAAPPDHLRSEISFLCTRNIPNLISYMQGRI